jgi:hypothetical protein
MRQCQRPYPNLHGHSTTDKIHLSLLI